MLVWGSLQGHDPLAIAQAKQKGSGKGRPDKRAKILCKFIKDPSLGECPQGDKCPFSHDPEVANKKSPPKKEGQRAGASSRVETRDDDDDGC